MVMLVSLLGSLLASRVVLEVVVLLAIVSVPGFMLLMGLFPMMDVVLGLGMSVKWLAS